MKGNALARPLNSETGELDLSDRQEKFLDWLVDPDRKGSQADCARNIGVDPSTLSKWKRDGSFRSMWEKRLAELNVQPDRIQKVVEALYDAAIGGGQQSVKAMELYLRFTERFIPKQIVDDGRGLRDLSDEDLADVAENVTFLRKKA